MDIKKIFKIVAWIALAIIILLIIAAIALVQFVDPNKFKPQIISAVSSATGRQLSLPGKLSWRFYPELGIELGAASLSNPQEFNQPTFAEINSASLGLSTWDLLHGEAHVSTLNLNGLRVFLIQGKNQNNWTFTTETPAKAPNEKTSNTSTSSYNLAIKSINVSNGGISYDNYQNKTHYALDNINLNAKNVSANSLSPIPISLSANYNINQNLTGTFKLNTEILYKEKTNILTVKDLALQNNLNYPTSNNNIALTSNLSADTITANFNAQTLAVPELDFNLNQVIKGEIDNINVNNLLSAPRYTASVKSTSFALNDFLKSLNLNPINTQNKSAFSQVNFSTNISGTSNAINLSNLKVNTNKSQLNANININSFAPFQLSENLSIDQLDLADLVDLKGAGLAITNIKSNGNINLTKSNSALFPSTLNGKINLNAQDIMLKGFDIKSLINSLDNVAKNLINLKQLGAASTQLQQQIQQISQQGINANNGKSTDLGTLNAQVNIDSGVITTPIMSLKGNNLQINGSGNINLTQQNMSYQLNTQMIGSTNSFVKSLVIPYQIQGNFSNLNQGLNWVIIQAQILKYIALQIGQAVQSGITQVIQQGIQGTAQGGQDVTQNAAKVLNSLFGQ